MNTQSISKVSFDGDEKAEMVLTISIGELRANWRCAASLARSHRGR